MHINNKRLRRLRSFNVGDSTKDSVTSDMETNPNCPPNLEKDKDYTACFVENKFN